MATLLSSALACWRFRCQLELMLIIILLFQWQQQHYHARACSVLSGADSDCSVFALLKPTGDNAPELIKTHQQVNTSTLINALHLALLVLLPLNPVVSGKPPGLLATNTYKTNPFSILGATQLLANIN